MYHLRNDKGILTAEVDNDTAGMMIRGAPGEWVEKKFVDGKRKTVFVFRDNRVFTGTARVAHIKIYIWEGYYLESAR